MGTERRVRHRKRIAAGVALVVPLFVTAPVGATERHVGPVRRLTRGPELRQASLAALATDTPYIIKNVKCGHAQLEPVRSPSLTLYTYGADGGANGSGKKGGAGSVAVGSYVLPVGTAIASVVGCKGQSARADSFATAIGGTTSNGFAGGNGGAGIANGESGGAGGGFSGWYFNAEPLVEAGAGGGAGGGSGGGAGGDGDRPGAVGMGGTATPGRPGTFDQPGRGGANGGSGGNQNNGGNGSTGSNRVGGGGGGAGILGAGGGGAGRHNIPTPGAGGGGGGSAFYTDAGYVADFGGAGHGSGLDGLSQIVRVRPIVNGPYWPGWDIVRGVAQNGTKSGGYIVDAFGGLHTFSQGTAPPATSGGPYWPGWDIVRGVAVLPDGTGGYILDGFGGLHSFKIGNNPRPPAVTNGPYFPGVDIARGVTILPGGTGGYVADGHGGLHPFSIGAHPKPPASTGGPYWPDFDVIRGVSSPFVLDANVAGGWLVDVVGAMYPWGQLLGAPTPLVAGNAVFRSPVVRGMTSFVVGAGGVAVDAYGGLHPFSSPGLP